MASRNAAASNEATAFVRHRLLRVLHGQAKSVIADFQVRHETQRLYPHAEKFQAIFWPLKSITA